MNQNGIHQFTLTIVVDLEIWRGKEGGKTLMERQLDPELHIFVNIKLRHVCATTVAVEKQ
jgi:hypothetical protein